MQDSLKDIKGVFGLYMGLKNPEILILIDKL